MPKEESILIKENCFLIFSLLLLLSVIMVSSRVLPKGSFDKVSDLVGNKHFRYVTWTAEALFNKAVSASLKAEKFLNDQKQTALVEAYFKNAHALEEDERLLMTLYSQPGQKNNAQQVDAAKKKYDKARASFEGMSPLTEAVLQNQTERTLLDLGFGVAGQIFPPVLYQVSDLPLNLILSTRSKIETVMGMSLKPGMDPIEMDELENEIKSSFDISGLIEPVGGVGTYPSMVMRTGNIHWLTDTVAHEWTHNYLSLRPLGIRYFKNYAMRSINETTASLSGRDIGRAVIAKFYPNQIRIGFIPMIKMSWVVSEDEIEQAGINFQHEMHKTRIRVDDLLEKGEVEAAEAYMEARRMVFWDAGYHIRKINQAYFAFYGSYSDTPGGAAGEDPIGLAVRGLRYSFKRLKPFIDTIQGVRSFSDLIDRAIDFGIIEKN